MLFLSIVFLVVTAINIGYYISFLAFSHSKNKEISVSKEVPISVIVCAKNEAKNLRQFIPHLLLQDYKNFEVILINDASRDESLEIMQEFAAQDSRIKIVNVENNETFWANKKYALTLGIKRAKNKYLLFTDADCQPESNKWIKEMAAHFSNQKQIVLGYGGYFQRKGVLNKLIRFETLLTAIQYFAYAKLGNPYMGVGRNLAYTSELFYENKGFASHLYIRSGDDDLFVNEAATNKNTAICFSENSFTRSIPKKTFSGWFTQKRRHTSIARHYKKKHQVLLAGFYASQLLFWFLFAFTLFYSWKIALVTFFIRWIVQFVVFYASAKKLKETDVLWLFPVLELFLVYIQFIIFITNLFSKPKHWK